MYVGSKKLPFYLFTEILKQSEGFCANIQNLLSPIISLFIIFLFSRKSHIIFMILRDLISS
jgi:hypothetical protein